ncbi:ArsR family transcriptional regulator [Pinirhizobacter sp.]|jgi:predicted ArsR family transcriptional regulator|uniref:ArsR family transcriptional regulator n=1 Tax=Pinirhizobacter sp. TaxID=2950432 RepID=UPI002F400B2C
MAPDSKASRVLRVLAEGPATTGEVAAELGWNVHLTCAHLKNLHLAGKVSRKRFPAPGRLVRFLWSIVDEGMRNDASH